MIEMIATHSHVPMVVFGIAPRFQRKWLNVEVGCDLHDL